LQIFDEMAFLRFCVPVDEFRESLIGTDIFDSSFFVVLHLVKLPGFVFAIIG